MRLTKDWLLELMKFVEETETPDIFWIWAGLFAVAATVQRRVWFPYGLVGNIYPNLLVMIIGPPGRVRKSVPLKFSKRILREVGIVPYADSGSKREFTKYFERIEDEHNFQWKNSIHKQCAGTVISLELSSLLANDPKALVECMTDLWDCGDTWDYVTSGAGNDILTNVCLNGLMATTPVWFTNNLPHEVTGTGFTSRLIMAYADKRRKCVPFPADEDKKIWATLVNDLKHIQGIVGPMQMTSEAKGLFEDWYHELYNQMLKNPSDARLSGSLDRLHINALKVSMLLGLMKNDNLIITLTEMEKSIILMEDMLKTSKSAFSGHGRSRVGLDYAEIAKQLRVYRRIKFSELLEYNFHNIDEPTLKAILEALKNMGYISLVMEPSGDMVINWIKEEEKKDGTIKNRNLS